MTGINEVRGRRFTKNAVDARMVGRRKNAVFRRSWRLFIRRYPKRWRNTAMGNGASEIYFP